jgi:hypothetical protein
MGVPIAVGARKFSSSSGKGLVYDCWSRDEKGSGLLGFVGCRTSAGLANRDSLG